MLMFGVVLLNFEDFHQPHIVSCSHLILINIFIIKTADQMVWRLIGMLQLIIEMPKKQQNQFGNDTSTLAAAQSSKATSINTKQKYITRNHFKIYYKNISRPVTKWIQKSFVLCQKYSLLDKVFKGHTASKNKNQIKNLNEEEAVALGQLMMKEIVREEERNEQEYSIKGQAESKQNMNQIGNHEGSIDRPISLGLLSFIEVTIKRLSTSLLIESIVCIVQIPSSFEGIHQKQVFVVFESCYPTILIPKLHLMHILKSEAYAEKKARYLEIMEESKMHGPLKNQNFAFCHRCLKPTIGGNAIVCNQQINEYVFNDSYNSTDPTLFHRHFFNAEFFTKTKPMILPYFIYRKNSTGRVSCNRVYCHECSEDSLVKKWCAVCLGNCNCSRCQKAHGIVKLLAGFKKEGGNMEELFHLLPIQVLVHTSEYPIRSYFGEWQLKDVARLQSGVSNKKTERIRLSKKGTWLAGASIQLERFQINLKTDAKEEIEGDRKCQNKIEENQLFFYQQIDQIDIQIPSVNLDEDCSLFLTPIN